MKDFLVPAVASIALVLLVWGFGEPFPTQDGPAHLYNASLLAALSSPATREAAPAIARVYELRPEYTASLPGHLALLASLYAVGAARAENLLITLYGVFLLWVLALGTCPGSRSREVAYLALPLTLNLCLDMGFYNFCLALPCLLLVVAWWARESRHARGTPGALFALLAAVLHPAAGLVLVGTIAAVELGDVLFFRRERARAALRSLVPLLPAALFLAWRLSGDPRAAVVWHDPRARVAELLIPLALFHGSTLSLLVAVAIGAVLWVQLAGRLRSWRTLDRCSARWLGAAGVVLAGVLLAPDEAAGGGYIGLRLNTIFFLLLLCAVGSAWTSTRSVPSVRFASPALALLSVVAVVLAIRTNHGRFSALARLSREVPEGSTVLGVAAGEWLRDDRESLVPPYARPDLHASLYVGVGRDIAVLNNYEARRWYFPVRYRDGMSPYGTVLRADDDEWRFPELSPVTAAGSCVSDFLLWEEWAHPATRRAFPAEVRDLVADHYAAVAEAGSYTLFRCLAGPGRLPLRRTP